MTLLFTKQARCSRDDLDFPQKKISSTRQKQSGNTIKINEMSIPNTEVTKLLEDLSRLNYSLVEHALDSEIYHNRFNPSAMIAQLKQIRTVTSKLKNALQESWNPATEDPFAEKACLTYDFVRTAWTSHFQSASKSSSEERLDKLNLLVGMIKNRTEGSIFMERKNQQTYLDSFTESSPFPAGASFDKLIAELNRVRMEKEDLLSLHIRNQELIKSLQKQNVGLTAQIQKLKTVKRYSSNFEEISNQNRAQLQKQSHKLDFKFFETQQTEVSLRHVLSSGRLTVKTPNDHKEHSCDDKPSLSLTRYQSGKNILHPESLNQQSTPAIQILKFKHLLENDNTKDESQVQHPQSRDVAERMKLLKRMDKLLGNLMPKATDTRGNVQRMIKLGVTQRTIVPRKTLFIKTERKQAHF